MLIKKKISRYKTFINTFTKRVEDKTNDSNNDDDNNNNNNNNNDSIDNNNDERKTKTNYLR